MGHSAATTRRLWSETPHLCLHPLTIPSLPYHSWLLSSEGLQKLSLAYTMDPSQEFYSFVKLTDLPSSLSFSIRVNSLQGNLQRSSLLELLESPSHKGWGTNIEPYPPFYLTLRLYSANKPLTPVHRTPFKAFKKAWVWNTTIDFGFPVRQLPLDAQLGITIWDSRGLSPDAQGDDRKEDRVIGGTTLRLFGKKGTLKKAQHRCFVHLGVKADGTINSETSSKGKLGEGGEEGKDGMSEMSRLEKVSYRTHREPQQHCTLISSFCPLPL
jgi:phosphatidylinositol 3-kinase